MRISRTVAAGLASAAIAASGLAGTALSTQQTPEAAQDEPMATIRDKDFSRVGIALASGAQVVTTDFPVAGMAARYDSDFVAALPGDTPRTMQSSVGADVVPWERVGEVS